MIALVSGAIWLVTFLVVLGGYIIMALLLTRGIRSRTTKAQLIKISAAACTLAGVLAWILLQQLVNDLPEKKLYIFTAFTKITWRPMMLWLAAAATLLSVAAHLLRRNKRAFLLGSGIALVCVYAGTWQTIVALFFGKAFFRATGVELHY
jgi:hypothetical protein